MTVVEAAALFLAGVVSASIGQVLMKKGALRGRDRSVFASFLDRYVIAGYVLMLVSTVTATIALKVMPLNLTVALQPLGYVFVALLSVAVLSERMQRHHVWGALIILLGIVLFDLGAR